MEVLIKPYSVKPLAATIYNLCTALIVNEKFNS